MNDTPAAPISGPIRTPSPSRLPRYQLVLAVEQAVAEAKAQQRHATIDELAERLWREDREVIAAAHDELFLEAHHEPPQGSRHGLHAERLRELYRPVPYRTSTENLTLSEIAEEVDMDRATLVALMVHHGYLELTFYGGQQRRHLVSDQAISAGLGHNVDASRSRIAAEGMNRCTVFPVFYRDPVADILWALDLDGITATARRQGDHQGFNKKAALRWLLRFHDHLPDAELARISGYSLSGVEKARKAQPKKDRLQVPAATASTASSGTDTLRAFALNLMAEKRRQRTVGATPCGPCRLKK